MVWEVEQLSGTWGNNLKISIFGESHGQAIGMVVDGLPAGLSIDDEMIATDMARRAPGQSWMSTKRREPDKVRIVSGVYNEKATGTPICGIIENTNTRSKDYSGLQKTVRPGHADYTGQIKYNGFNDYRGGGHFSGRITAPIVFAGALCRKYLLSKGIEVGAHIAKLAGVSDQPMETVDAKMLSKFRSSDFPLVDESKAEEMQNKLKEAIEQHNSVGGVIECAVVGIEAGIGDPFFDSLESRIASLLFSVPAVKGVEFGAGFGIADMKGSQANDDFCIREGQVKTETNNNGGILGGISNSMPIIVRAAIKPTPSIAKKQKTVDIESMTQTDIEIHGRHDPCIVVRAVSVIEAAVMIALTDAML